jgi:hypothetical protein
MLNYYIVTKTHLLMTILVCKLIQNYVTICSKIPISKLFKFNGKAEAAETNCTYLE